jgi:hypothetical protein
MNQRTVYCGKLHRTEDGVPVEHACRVLAPEYLHAERAQEYGRAATILERMRMALHGGVPLGLAGGTRAPDGAVLA